MPLRRGICKKTIGENIGETMRSGRPRRQAIAMALSEARRSAHKAGSSSRRRRVALALAAHRRQGS